MSTETTEYEPSNYQAGPADPEIRTTWQYVVDHTDDPSTLFCDTRGPDEYLGRDVRAERGGHIPGSINVEWTAAVNSNGTFKSADALAALYGGAGFTSDRQIITYCQSGVRGAHTWFVLSELLGYPRRPKLRRIVGRVRKQPRESDRELVGARTGGPRS